MSRIKKLGFILTGWPLLTAFIYFNQGTGASIGFGACGAFYFCSELIDYIHEKNTGEPYFKWSKEKDHGESYFDGGGGFVGGGDGGGGDSAMTRILTIIALLFAKLAWGYDCIIFA